MRIAFIKYDGAGNDFVLIDNREGKVSLTAEEIARICHRRRGVGADGLLLLNEGGGDCDFAMEYYNSDGHAADMCGNGARCIAAFGSSLGLGRTDKGQPTLRFRAADGLHEAAIVSWDTAGKAGIVTVGMKEVEKAGVRRCMDGWLLDTGVPHYVVRVKGLWDYDVAGEGRRLRHQPQLGPAGANVNFVEQGEDGLLHVRTYERGVEDETWACGTGVTACAIVTGCGHLRTRGGDFEVDYRTTANAYTDVRLTGPVELNFTGVWEI